MLSKGLDQIVFVKCHLCKDLIKKRKSKKNRTEENILYDSVTVLM